MTLLFAIMLLAFATSIGFQVLGLVLETEKGGWVPDSLWKCAPIATLIGAAIMGMLYGLFLLLALAAQVELW